MNCFFSFSVFLLVGLTLVPSLCESAGQGRARGRTRIETGPEWRRLYEKGLIPYSPHETREMERRVNQERKSLNFSPESQTKRPNALEARKTVTSEAAERLASKVGAWLEREGRRRLADLDFLKDTPELAPYSESEILFLSLELFDASNTEDAKRIIEKFLNSPLNQKNEYLSKRSKAEREALGLE